MSTTERAGFAKARLASVDRILKEKYVDRGRLPGSLIQIRRKGELAHMGLTGLWTSSAGSRCGKMQS
jgi:hypothetical protein